MLASFAVTTMLVVGSSCTLPPTPEEQARLSISRRDSVIEARARDSSPQWRADHYVTLDLHGPFPRPKLPPDADSNDAAAYYQLGVANQFGAPGLADHALYWAIRLDPTMAVAYWARWDLRHRYLRYRLYPGDSVRPVLRPLPNEEAAVDSLRQSALMFDPFLDGALIIPPQVRRLTERQADRDPLIAGLWFYAAGNYAKAAQKWGDAIRKKPEYAGLHVARAFAWLHVKDGTDSAVADLTALIDRIERIEDSTVAPYVSKDFLYYAVGLLRTGQSRYADARAAYESALSENLGFYMAHVRLSAIDFRLHDTTSALTELETASMIRGDDPLPLAFRGQILLRQGRLKEADAPLRAAVHADTDFAMTYAFLGELAEQRHDTATALRSYREYLGRASHTAAERAWVEDRVAHLTQQSQPAPSVHSAPSA